MPRGTAALVVLVAGCAAVEWHLGIFESQGDIVRLLAAHADVVFHGEVHRLVTASFFHLSVPHFVGNSIGLLILGGYLEFRVGTPRFVVIALTSAVGSILGSVLIGYVPWVAGASGMLYGLYGALAALLVRYWSAWDFDYSIPRWLAVVGMIALLLGSQAVALRALPAFAIIDEANHWSGFAVGALATAGLTKNCPARSLWQDNRGISRIARAEVMLFVIAFLIQARLLWMQ